MARILVIDDTAVIRDLLQETLTAHGYEVVVAATSDAGMRHLNEKIPDLIISDIDLPDISGIEVCKILRSRTETRNVAFIIMTGSSTNAQLEGFQAGADDFIFKPFKVEEMVERVRAVLRRTQTQARSAAPAPMPEPAPPLAALEAPAAARAPAAAPSPAAAAPKSLPAQARVATPWYQATAQFLLQPHTITADTPYPPIAAGFLGALLATLNFGIILSPGSASQPVMLSMMALWMWASAMAVLMLGCSLCGIPIIWQESARIIALAGVPLLLKSTAACLFVLITTLDPFLFSASPALLVASPPFLAARLDVFELWSLAVLWFTLSRRPHTSKAAATIITAAAWLILVGMLIATRQLQAR
ncbi:MAG: hypothetical protein A2V88_11990 [Elusimicrobia bacterium RBG_16_66_12]|nr:MAG: hypothetical protein A2V88_11990 [Elusimicrobia bacterium RBG_16_66_12]